MSIHEATWLLLLVNLAATFYMVGLVWFVQRVHYPLFGGVGAAAFASYESEHVARTGPVVGPPMLVEAATALALCLFPPETVAPALTWSAAALLAVIWLSTGLLQVPRHRELARGFAAPAHRSLVATNWIRTIAWSARGVLAVAMLFEAARTLTPGALAA